MAGGLAGFRHHGLIYWMETWILRLRDPDSQVRQEAKLRFDTTTMILSAGSGRGEVRALLLLLIGKNMHRVF